MRALQYEGTPAEIAQGFKEQGNEMVKVKRWKDGKEYYTKAVAVLINSSHPSTSIVEEVAESPSDRGKEEGAEEEKILLEACFVNRALCNLELSMMITDWSLKAKMLTITENFRSTTLDCASALRLNPQNVKAYYRSSTALLALEKLVEASDACARGLIINPGNAPLKALDAKIKARKELFWDGQEKKRQQAERAHKEKIALATALRARNIVTRTTSQPPDMEDANIHLAPHPLSPTSTLQFPVILLYPLHAQSDFIKSFPETDTVPIHLEYIFPLPWDKEQEYKSGGVEFYMTTSDGGLVKVGKKVSLGKVLGSGGIEILDGLVRIYVLPKARAAHWIGEMRMRKGRSVG